MYSHRIEFLQESSYSAENDPSKIFSCIRASANTGPACIRANINSPRILSCMYWFCAGGYCGRAHTKGVMQPHASSKGS